MDERRKLPRWEVNKEVKVWIPMTQGFSHFVLEDIHLKGMRVSFNRKLPHEKTVRMSFDMDNNYEFIKVETQICWRVENEQRNCYGLSFSQINEEAKQKIDRYITANCYDQIKNKWWSV